jgi:hypothetical protein
MVMQAKPKMMRQSSEEIFDIVIEAITSPIYLFTSFGFPRGPYPTVPVIITFSRPL